MSTRAVQITELLTGLVHPTTGEILSSHTAFFYAAGTSTPKNVWTEKEKTNAYTEYDLSAIGNAQLYAEGVYKIVIEVAASGDDGDIIYTWDNLKFEHPNYYVHTITENHDQTSEDDYVLVNTTGGQVTISMLSAADWTHPFKFRRTTGSNSVVIDPDGSETIDGSATMTINSDAIIEIVSDGSNLITAGFKSSFADADNDTKIQVEESADEDKIRFDIGGSEVVVIDSDSIDSANNLIFSDDIAQILKSADTGALVISSGTNTTDGGAIRLNGANESPSSNVVVYANNSAQLTVNDTGIHPYNADSYVSTADGNLSISETSFDVTSAITTDTWETVGPTDSGADNEWAGLEDVPTDVSFIEIMVASAVSRTTGSDGTAAASFNAYAQKNAVTDDTGLYNCVANVTTYGTSTVYGYDSQRVVKKIPVGSGVIFKMYWTTTGTPDSTGCIVYLTGYGYNQ
jgi:hypothetical protein